MSISAGFSVCQTPMPRRGAALIRLRWPASSPPRSTSMPAVRSSTHVHRGCIDGAARAPSERSAAIAPTEGSTRAKSSPSVRAAMATSRRAPPRRRPPVRTEHRGSWENALTAGRRPTASPARAATSRRSPARSGRASMRSSGGNVRPVRGGQRPRIRRSWPRGKAFPYNAAASTVNIMERSHGNCGYTRRARQEACRSRRDHHLGRSRRGQLVLRHHIDVAGEGR